MQNYWCVNNRFIYILTIICFVFLRLGLFNSYSQALVLDTNKTLGGNSKDKMVSVYEISDNNIIMGGSTESSVSGELTDVNNGGSDYWIILLDSSTMKPIWNKTYGGSKDDVLAHLKLLSDGNYLLTGSSKSDVGGDKTQNSKGGWDYWVVKIKPDGTKIWDKTYGGSADDVLEAAAESWDGGYIIGGYSSSPKSGDKTENSKGGTDYWILKIDANGNFKWDKTFGGSLADTLTTVLSDDVKKRYFIGGYSSSPADNDKTASNVGAEDYWAVLIDNKGNKIWDKTYGGGQTDVLASSEMSLTQNGYLMVCYSNSNAGGSKSENSIGGYDYWIVSTDSAGNVVWDNTLGGNRDDIATCVLFSIEGSYVIGGYSISDGGVGDKLLGSNGEYDYWLLKIDSLGKKIYDYDLGASDNDYMFCLSQSCNRGFYVGGESYSGKDFDKSESNRGVSDYWLVKLNSPTIPSFTFNVACEGEVTLFYDKTEVFPDFWYWTFDDPSSGSENSSYEQYPSHTFNKPGTYNITLVVKEGCQKDTTITVQVVIPENRLRGLIELGKDTILCEGDVMQLSVPYDSSYIYLWNTGATSNKILIGAPGTYSITATDGICSNTDEILIGEDRKSVV